ncbi:MAG: YdcF family protein [Bacteroidota bacterium]
MNRNVLVTFIYPAVLSYLNDLWSTINDQACKDFDVIIFSDHINKNYLKTIKNNQLTVIPTSGTPTIVLGGAVSWSSKWRQMDFNKNGDRITETIRLYRLGRIKKIIILGESAFKEKYAPQALQYMAQMGVNPADIILEQQSRTTRENILFVKSILEEQEVKDNNILLITSGWHMRRALKGFNQNGIHPTPYAVDVPSPEPVEKWNDLLPTWQAALQWQKLFHEIAGLLVI